VRTISTRRKSSANTMGGWPILIERMDHAALLAGVELAPGKARTAALFKKPSQALEDAINGAREVSKRDA